MANRNSENVNKQIADIVADEMNKSVINIKTNIRRERAYASGRASNSLSTIVTQTATGAKGVIASNVSYFNALETGRGPFKGRNTIFSNEKENLIRRITDRIAPLFNGENDSVEIKFN